MNRMNDPSTATRESDIPPPVPYRGLVYLGCAIFALAVNGVLGKEMAWDTLSYHFYAGFSALHDRLGQDYFAGGFQSYLNPLAYVPFYVLAASGLPALLVASLLAVVHSAILALSFELGLLVSPSEVPRARLLTGLSAVALTAANPILLQEIGSSFADITTAELVLAGWLLLGRAIHRPRTSWIVAAGLLLGAASGLKLTNAVHALATFAMFAALPLPSAQRWRTAALYGLALGAGFLAVAAPWAWRMENAFGNPLFPLFNNWFHSPEFPTAPLRHYRFIPSTFVEGLLRPFTTIDPAPMVQTELMSPDPRYAAFVLLLAAWPVLSWIRRRRGDARQATARSIAARRVTVAMSLTLIVDWTLWLYASGNGRYFLAGACLAGVALVGLSFEVFRGQAKLRNYVFAFALGVQLVQLGLGTQYRWDSVAWGGPWFDVRVPEPLRTTPYLYLTIGGESKSYIAPFLPAASGLVNFSSAYALGPQGANGRHVGALIRRYAPRVRVLITGERIYPDDARRQPSVTRVDRYLERFGLRVNPADCATITVEGLPPPAMDFTVASAHAGPTTIRPIEDHTSLATCAVVSDPGDHAADRTEERLANEALDRLEDACPALFQPPRPVTEHIGTEWSRIYLNTDLNAWVNHGHLRAHQEMVEGGELYLGRQADWLDGSIRLECGRRHGRYFARVVPAATK